MLGYGMCSILELDIDQAMLNLVQIQSEKGTKKISIPWEDIISDPGKFYGPEKYVFTVPLKKPSAYTSAETFIMAEVLASLDASSHFVFKAPRITESEPVVEESNPVPEIVLEKDQDDRSSPESVLASSGGSPSASLVQSLPASPGRDSIPPLPLTVPKLKRKGGRKHKGS
jgi:hypothetical protein